MVRLSIPDYGDSAIVWTGAVISPHGEMLTTSRSLEYAPLVDFQLADGTQGQACVTGRNDNIGLALLKPLLEPRSYDFLALSDEPPTIGDQLGLLQHSNISVALDTRLTRVSGYQPFDPGHDYFQIQASDSTADGAVLINAIGKVQGMRMPLLWLLQHEIADPGEVWAVDAPEVASTALSLLRSGHMYTAVPFSSGIYYEPTGLPIIIIGEITVGGVPAPVDSVLHAKASKEGQPDRWDYTWMNEPGFFIMQVNVLSHDYVGATIEFWMDCRRSSTTAVFEGPPGKIVKVDLAF